MDDIDTKNIRKCILKTIIAAGYQIAPDALDFITSQSMGKRVIEEIITQSHTSLKIPTVITLDFLRVIGETNTPAVKEQSGSDLEKEAIVRKAKGIRVLKEREQFQQLQRDREPTSKEKEQVQQMKSHSSVVKTELTVTTNLGREITIQVKSTDKELILDRPLFDLNVNTYGEDELKEYIPEIDLTPVSVCRNLKIFELLGLGLHSVDLSPLEDCRELQKFSFKGPQQPYYESARNYEDISYGESGALIKEIDLSLLKNCENLRVIVLSNLNLDSLDLTPLNECINLEELHIINPFDGKVSGHKGNRTWEKQDSEENGINLDSIRNCVKLRVLKLVTCPPISLNPLRGFTNLEQLEISDGSLSEIDLGIFGDCFHLKIIDLHENGYSLRSIDLGVLSKLPNLREINLWRCMLDRIDFGPLIFRQEVKNGGQRTEGLTIDYGHDWEEIEQASIVTLLSQEAYEGKSRSIPIINDFFDIPVEITSLHTIEGYYNSLKATNEPSWKLVHLLQCIPNSIGIPHLGLLDVNPDEFLPKIFKQTYEPDDNVKIQELYTKYLCEQIDRGGTTIGINLDKDTPSEIIMRSSKILDLREKEMQRVSISISEEGIVDYLPLWMTAYGSRVLTSLGKQLNDKVSELPEIEKAMQEIGYRFRLINGPTLFSSLSKGPTKMSLFMMQYIRIMCDISKLWDPSLPQMKALNKEYILDLPYFTR